MNIKETVKFMNQSNVKNIELIRVDFGLIRNQIDWFSFYGFKLDRSVKELIDTPFNNQIYVTKYRTIDGDFTLPIYTVFKVCLEVRASDIPGNSNAVEHHYIPVQETICSLKRIPLSGDDDTFHHLSPLAIPHFFVEKELLDKNVTSEFHTKYQDRDMSVRFIPQVDGMPYILFSSSSLSRSVVTKKSSVSIESVVV